MKTPKVTVGLITFKGIKYLEHSLSSLLDQDYSNIEYVIRDQSPEGEAYDWIKKNHPEFFDKATIFKGENLMHSGGHNALIREMKGDIYVFVGYDMLYPNDFVSKMVEAMQKDDTHVATCKVMHWDFAQVEKENLHGSKSDVIDTYGIGITKSHKFFDTAQGHKADELSKMPKILGPSGTLGALDKKALKAISYKNKEGKLEYFDENLHYKNDCDLSYRLGWAGLKCSVVDSMVYHDRQLGETSTGMIKKFKDHHQKGAWGKESSLLGHLVTVRKNFDPNYSFSVKLRTRLSLMARYLYTLFLAPKMLKTYAKVKKMEKEIEARKKQMKKKVSAEEMETLMV